MSRVQGVGPVLAALVSGSMVLGGRICTCVMTAGSRLWETASTNPAETAERQEAANAAARKRAAAKAKAAAGRRRKRADDDDQDDLDDDAGELTEEQLAAIVAPPVAMVRRGKGDALAVLGLGGLLASAGAYAGARTVGPMIVDLVGGNGSMIVCGGAVAWTVAAWMVSPPPAPAAAEADDQDVEEEDDLDVEGDDLDVEEDDQDVAQHQGSPGDRLARHVLEQLAALEQTYGGRGGLHVVTLIASAEAAGILSPGAMTTDGMRTWLRSSGFVLDKSTRQPQGVPTTIPSGVGYGVKVGDMAGVFGRTVSETVQRLYGAPAPGPVQAPLHTPAEAPATAPVQPLVPAPAEAPAAPPAAAPHGAPAGAVPAPRLYLVKPPSPEPSQDGAQDAV